MARATAGSLTTAEQELLGTTSRAALRELNEDGLADLLVRVRRARDKAVSVHRRQVSAQVGELGARGVASLPPRRSASKAELFEAALSRTSGALAAAARQNARELREERLAAGRGEGVAPLPPATRKGASPATPSGRGRGAPRTSRAKDASTLATGARRQAKRDSKR